MYCIGRDITQRKQAEQEIRESEERFRATFEQAAVGIAHVALDGQFLHINQKFCDIVGYTPQEMQNLSFQVITHPDDLTTDLANVRQLLNGEIESYSMEKRYFHKNGEIVWVNLTVSLLREDSGEPRWFVAVVEDITSRKQIEQALNESEAKYRNLVEQANDGIAVVQAERIVFANRSFAEITGRTFVGILNTPFTEYIPADDVPKIASLYQRRLDEETPSISETTIQHKDGSQVEVEFNAGLTIFDGKPAVQVIIRDITERKQAEAALSKIEENFRAVIEQSPVSIQIHGLDGKLLQSNPAYAALYALNEQALAELYEKYNLLQDEQAERLGVMPFIEKAYAGEEVAFPPYEYDGIDTLQTLDFKNPISRKCWVQTLGFPLRDEQSNVTSVVFMSEDITERKQAEAALQATEEQFRQLMEQSPMSIQVMTPDGRITKVNQAFMTLWGISEDSLPEVLENYNILEDEEARQRGVMPLIKKAFKGENIVLPVFEYDAGSVMDTIGVNTKANKRWIQPRLYPVKDAQGEVVSVVEMEEDITERRQGEQQILEYQERLKALASQLTVAEEKERRRIAAELHDNVGQMLAFARMRLASARKISADTKQLVILDDISGTLQTAIEDTQNLVFDLSSPLLNEVGLAAAISEWLEQQVGKRFGLRTEFIEEGSKPALDEDVRAILFRNVRELLTNVVRHADASQVTVRLKNADHKIEVIVEDDGIGFDPDAVSHTGVHQAGFGLFSIQERMNDMGGAFLIESEPGQGTQSHPEHAPRQLTIQEQY